MFYSEFIKDNIAYKNASQIGVYDVETNNKLGILNLNNLKNNAKSPNYVIGLFSDAMPYETFSTENATNIVECINNSISFFKEKKVNFVIGLGNNGLLNNIDNNITYYSCRGNIDKKLFSLKEWNNSINNNVYFYDKSRNSSYYFQYQKYVFIILSNENENNGSYDYEIIKWLHTLLDKNRNKAVFVIIQEPFYHKAGNIYGTSLKRPYIENLVDYNNDYNSFLLLNKLNNYYLNSIWISGFTRFPFEVQKQTKFCNISSYDNLSEKQSAYNIHVPSISCAKNTIIDGTEITLSDDWGVSQGYLMEIYKNEVILYGVNFKKNNEFVNEFYPLATYKIKLQQHNINSNLELI